MGSSNKNNSNNNNNKGKSSKYITCYITVLTEYY